MFTSDIFYIIVGDKSLIIKKQGEKLQEIIEFISFIPNVPFYCHLFDEDKNYIEEMKSLVKKLKIKNAMVIVPDDSIDLEIDRRLFIEFFMRCGVRKVNLKSQCFLLSLEDKKYISISRTTRTIVLQYIANNKSIAKKYYDKNYLDIKQIALDSKHLHADYEYDSIPVYINNINNDMEKYEDVGILISFDDFITNTMNS
ncbi:MAG: hypothetical protein ACERKV_01700 [Clostridiaceae bacterium]